MKREHIEENIVLYNSISSPDGCYIIADDVFPTSDWYYINCRLSHLDRITTSGKTADYVSSISPLPVTESSSLFLFSYGTLTSPSSKQMLAVFASSSDYTTWEHLIIFNGPDASYYYKNPHTIEWNMERRNNYYYCQDYSAISIYGETNNKQYIDHNPPSKRVPTLIDCPLYFLKSPDQENITQGCFDYLEIKDSNNILLHSFKPAMKGDVKGIYDEATGKFYKQANSGTLVLE